MHRSPMVSSLMSRYADAYLVARTIDGLGVTIKYAGIGIGSLMAFAAVASSTIAPVLIPASLGFARIIVATVGAAVAVAVGGGVGAMLFLLGTVTSAQAQVLQAALDTAVNTSGILSDADRAQIMSLPIAPGGAVHVAGAFDTNMHIPIATASEQI